MNSTLTKPTAPGVRPRPAWAVIFDATNAGICTALWLSLVPRILNGPSPSGAAILGTLFLAIVVADAFSGIVHWFFDTFLDETTAVVGPLLVAPFREHHDAPEAMTEHGLLELLGNSCMGCIPIVGSAWWLGPVEPESGFGVCGYIFLLVFSAAVTMSNKFHAWAHSDAVPRLAGWLRQLGLAIGPQRHARHHKPPFRTAYCVFNGWFDYLAEPIGFFDYAERFLVWLGVPRRMLTIAIIVCTLLFPSALSAQSNYAVLSGVVEDPQGHATPAASIELTASATGAQRRTTSNEIGIFQITGLLPGEYTIAVKASGFAGLSQNVRLEAGQQLNLNLNLKVATVVGAVDVLAEPEVLRTTDASVGEVVERAAVQNLPLNGRMMVDLVLTVPGAHLSHGAQAGDINPLYWRPGQRSSLSVGGNRPNANFFLLDGTTNTDLTFNTLNLSPSPDAVQEFSVQTGSYSAEMGGAGGGQVNIVTRSGTNQFHGTAYEFLRNDALDARTFNEMGSNHLVRNNFGGSLGGPISLNRTFFFGNYEGLRHSKSDTMIATVPTPDEIAGDFSRSGVTIYNPFSARTNPAFDASKPVSAANPQIIRDAFPGNVIPAGLVHSPSASFLRKYLPQPNLDMGMVGCGMTMMGTPLVVGAGTDCNNYLDVRNEHHSTNQGTFRIDHLFSDNNSISVRHSISSERGFMPQNLPGFGALHDNMSQQGNIAWNRVISPRLVNIVSIGISRLAMHRSSENSENNDIVSELGIQGVGFGGKGAYGAPWFSVQGYNGMGDTFAATPMHAWDTVIEARDLLNWQTGRHALKFGGSMRRLIWPMWGFFQNRGFYQYTAGFTTQTATNDGTGSALASFLLGLPAVKQRQAGIPQMQLRQIYGDAFVQDSFRLSRRTTLQLGLRYEYMSPLTDIRYTNSNLTFLDGKPAAFIGGQNGYPTGLKYANKLNFAPRLGLSHDFPDWGMVFHAGYGIFFTPIDLNTWCNQRHNVPYVFPETQQSDNFVPAATLIASRLNFGEPVLGQTTVSFAAFEPKAPAQYLQQWSLSLEKSLGPTTTLEVGYLGSHSVHLQRAHLINNAPAGPGAIGPRRPFPTLSFVPNTVLPDTVKAVSTTFPVSGINVLENSAQSWYDAGYVNVRRRYARGLSVLANYTWAKSLSDAPDFRSPMFESTIPQNNNDLGAEKGLACDIRHRFSLSAVYALPSIKNSRSVQALTRNWNVSAMVQAQTGFPFTVSVFGDTANSGTLLGENPIRANYTGAPVFGPGTRTAGQWFNPLAFATPAAFTFGNVGRNTVTGPGLQTLDLALHREFGKAEGVKFQLRGELFNALNHTNLGTPNRFVNTPQFGTITEAATPGREVQLSARLSF